MREFKPEDSLNAYCDELNAQLAQGEISEADWYEARRKATDIAYLSRDNPRAQSGHGGDEARWRYTRVLMILEGLHKDGSFLDVGCANGYLVECLARWVTGTGLDIEFYGIDISEGLIELARRRLPQRAERFSVANAVLWTPDRTFDYVHAHELSYAPAYREREFLEHLLGDCLRPGGRLIVGPWAVHSDLSGLENRLASWGYEPTGSLLKTHAKDSSLTRKMIWFDKPMCPGST